ncbi:MAG: glycosyltransferase family 2 protein, partial [Lachnospiraceae bacterium]|nr:glycosyltransferase family 2 protein [Lachnospiraceae bacterium]
MRNEKDDIKVSIIMPSFNVANYIRECMESVIHQTLKEIEILVVDARSTDGTYEILKEYEAKDPRVHILIDDRASTGYANNIAIDHAQGKYIGIVETDDYVRRDMYEMLYHAAEITECDIVKGDYDSFSGDGVERRSVKHHLAPAKKYRRIIDPERDDHIFEYVMFNWAGIYRRDFLNEFHIRHQETGGASFQDNGFFFLAYAYARKKNPLS